MRKILRCISITPFVIATTSCGGSGGGGNPFLEDFTTATDSIISETVESINDNIVTDTPPTISSDNTEKVEISDFEGIPTMDENGTHTLKITGWNGKGAGVVIPGELTHTKTLAKNTITYKVTEISDSVFRNKADLVNVDFTNAINLKEISSGAFEGTGMTELDLSTTKVDRIGAAAFRDTKIETFKSSDMMRSISDAAFANAKLKTIELNEGIESVGSLAFANSSKLSKSNALTSVTFPKTLEVVGDSAFYANDLSSVTFETPNDSLTNSEGIKIIGSAAFAYNQLDDNLKIPSTINTIKDAAFVGNNDITQIDVSGIETFTKGAFGNNVKIVGDPGSETFVVDKNYMVALHYKKDDNGRPTKEADYYTFLGKYWGAEANKLYNELVIYDEIRGHRLKKIPTNFMGVVDASKTKTFKISNLDNLEEIGKDAFRNIRGIEKIEIKNNKNLRVINDGAFSRHAKTNIDLINNPSLTTLGRHAFRTNLGTPYEFGFSGNTSLRYIGKHAFLGAKFGNINFSQMNSFPNQSNELSVIFENIHTLASCSSGNGINSVSFASMGTWKRETVNCT